MGQRSPVQQFIQELRRRHVPQTAAVYLVAAWAAIQFADVVAPNLGWPQSVVTAVIIAAAVGFPAVLVLAWVFELGPGGIHRQTDEEPAPSGPGEPTGSAPAAAGGGSGPTWIAAVAVLLVAIGSGVGVALLLSNGGPPEGQADGVAGETGDGAPVSRAERRNRPGVPVPPIPEISAPGAEGEGAIPPSADWRAAMQQAMGALDSIGGIEQLRALSEDMMRDGGVLISSPEGWGEPQHMALVAPGDTIRVAGVAQDTAGVVAVSLDGRVVAAADPPSRALPFRTTLIAQGGAPRRMIPLIVHTADGREIRREYSLVRVP